MFRAIGTHCSTRSEPNEWSFIASGRFMLLPQSGATILRLESGRALNALATVGPGGTLGKLSRVIGASVLVVIPEPAALETALLCLPRMFAPARRPPDS